MYRHFGCPIILYKAEASSSPSIHITPFLKIPFEYALEIQDGISALCKGRCDSITLEVAKPEGEAQGKDSAKGWGGICASARKCTTSIPSTHPWLEL